MSQEIEKNLVLSNIFTMDSTFNDWGSAYYNWSFSSSVYEVPENKIWKIEYISGGMDMIINGKGARTNNYLLTQGNTISFNKSGRCSSNGCNVSDGFTLLIIEYFLKESE